MLCLNNTYFPNVKNLAVRNFVGTDIFDWGLKNQSSYATWKVSKYGVFSGLYFQAFALNTEKYGQEKNPYLEIFNAVILKFAVDIFVLCDCKGMWNMWKIFLYHDAESFGEH